MAVLVNPPDITKNVKIKTIFGVFFSAFAFNRPLFFDSMCFRRKQTINQSNKQTNSTKTSQLYFLYYASVTPLGTVTSNELNLN